VIEDVKDRVFEFTNKSGIRYYQIPPTRNFLIENHDGKWIYWGLVHILGLTHDYVNKTTSGTFKLISIFSPDEMKMAHGMIDGNHETQFFK